MKSHTILGDSSVPCGEHTVTVLTPPGRVPPERGRGGRRARQLLKTGSLPAKAHTLSQERGLRSLLGKLEIINHSRSGVKELKPGCWLSWEL